MQIKTIIVLDPCGILSTEDETDGILMELAQISDHEIDLVRATDAGMYAVRSASADLLIIDYGGLSVGGGVATAQSQVWAALHWAEDHPGSLVVIWTQYTFRVYQEVAEQFAGLENVLCRFVSYGENEDFVATFNGWFHEEVA